MNVLIALATASPSAAASSASLDITQVLQFGLLGLIFLCLVFRKFIVPEWTLKAAEERSDREKAELATRLSETREQLERLQAVFQDQMIPALTRATEINARYTEELQKARYTKSDRPDQDGQQP